jgi:hypothetical protein
MKTLKWFCIILLLACVSCGDDTDSKSRELTLEYNSQVVMDEIERFNAEYPEYAITVQSEIETKEVIMTSSQDNAGEALTKIICEEGGYDIAGYTGETAYLSEYDIGEDCGDVDLHLVAFSDGASCICLHTLWANDEGYHSAPGVENVFSRCQEP